MKDSSRGSSLGRFARRFWRHKRRLSLGFLAIPLAQLGDVGITLLIRDALDKIEAGEGAGHQGVRIRPPFCPRPRLNPCLASLSLVLAGH